MTFWLVKAKPITEKLVQLRERLDSGEVSRMRPFGRALDRGLRDARVQPEGYATWEEEDYCTPPLAQERRAVLDTYFSNLTVDDVGESGRGWKQIEDLPSLWKS